MTPCSLSKLYWRFKRTCCLHCQSYWSAHDRLLPHLVQVIPHYYRITGRIYLWITGVIKQTHLFGAIRCFT